jgi:hypothetical protein
MSTPHVTRFFRWILVFPWLILLCFLGWMLMKRFPRSGIVQFDIPFNGTTAWITPFLPAERVSSPGPQADGWNGQRIFQDPVYTSLRLPGVYDRLDIDFEFRPIRQPFVEVGIAHAEDLQAFDFQPLWFEPLASGAWQQVTGAGVRGYVRSGAASSTLESGEYARLALWHASATPILRSDPPGIETRTRVNLRGSHDVWALPAGREVAFTFELQDVNRAKGPDTLVVRVYRNGAELQREVVGIGGSRDVQMGAVFSKTVRITDAVPGVYRIRIVADDDVFIRSIQTASQHWVLGPRLVFGDQVGYRAEERPGEAWTNSRHLVLQTFHQEGLQEITLGPVRIPLTRIRDVFSIHRSDADTGIQRFHAPRGDVRVVGDGWFALTQSAFFTPEPRRVTDQLDPLAEDLLGILTPYERPQALGDGWYRGRVSFSLMPGEDRVRLALSTPGIGNRSGAVDIRRVTLTYTRPALSRDEWWRRVRQEFVNGWYRLRGI